MNKIVLDESIIKDFSINKDTELFIGDFPIKDIAINIKDNVKVLINSFCNNNNHKIKYLLGKNSSLTVNKLSVNGNDQITILLNGQESSIYYNYAHINNLNSEYNICIYHNNCNTISNVINHGVCTNNNSLIFKVNGYDHNKANRAIINQDNKIIYLKNNYACIEPNLYINNNEVIANHSAYIGNFNKDILFYLMSRGLSFVECQKLLMKTFLIGNMVIDYDIKHLFLEIVKNIWE